MKAKINKNTIQVGLLCLGVLLGIVSIFCLFGEALEYWEYGYGLKPGESMFNYIFGNNDVFTCPGLVVLFVFQLIAIIGGIVLVVLFFLNKLNKKQLTIGIVVLAVILLTCAILSFLTKSFVHSGVLRDISKRYCQGGEVPEYIKEGVAGYLKDARISSGPISYSVLTLIGFVSLSSSALMLNLKK